MQSSLYLKILGGYKAYNCGSIEAEWTVRTWAQDADQPTIVGSVKLSEYGFDVSGDVLKAAMDKLDSGWSELDFQKHV